MIINKDTKILKIIKENENAIFAIASVNKNFKKLHNPFLRKLLASRISVKDAAKVGNTTTNSILKKLEEIGLKVEYTKEEDLKEIKHKKTITRNENIVSMDVRPILSSGTDPYHVIIETLKTMNLNKESLLIINSFEPVPLLNKLKEQGYEYEVERPDNKTVYTYLTKTGEVNDVNQKKKEISEKPIFSEIEELFKDKMQEIDVRDLEMPLPMVTVLEEIEKLNKNEALYVHHKRLPQYLLPELETRGWTYVNKEIDENNMKFIIFKK